MLVFARARYSFCLPALNVIETFSTTSSSQESQLRESAVAFVIPKLVGKRERFDAV